MLNRYPVRMRRTVAALILTYSSEHYSLTEEDLARIIAHAESFFGRLPVHMRLGVWLILTLFALSSYLFPPYLRPFYRRQPAERQQIYARWLEGHSYTSFLVYQLLHLTFLGSLYSQDRILRTIGFRRVS